ncbi:MAG TPA: carboxymuconolactone decarboxylase family protein, partial [Thermobifida alba]|nr:carboxymuconolactone decarboxylase family protein [Thermobifida alba]
MEARPNDSAGPTAGTTVHHVTAAGRAVRDSPLPARAQEPVAPRVSRINGRAARVDRPTEEAAAAGQTPVRPNPVAAWREATVFGGAERAAPELAEQGARIADTATGGTDEVGERATRH